ncbi:MAG: M3 family metallopeptidase [Blastocatellia bacterium]|nr:M3 family metallopeptidase [Blastocatellia bacterium]
MKLRSIMCAAAVAAVVVTSMSFTTKTASAETKPYANPLLEKWSGPFGGLPPFDKIKTSDFEPAFEAAMVENLKEIDAITANTEAPTFANTIEALEDAGRTLDRVSTIFYTYSSSNNTEEFGKLEEKMAPKLAAFGDKITQNTALFKRIEAVYEIESKNRMARGEKFRLIENYYKNFVRSGAKLDATQKARLGEINQQLAGLFTKFSQNLLGDESGLWVELKTEDDMKGMSQSMKDAAAAAAKAKNVNALGIIRNTRSSVDPFLTYSERRDLREKVWKMFINRGDNGDSRDNNAVISQILQLRFERAKLLGYKTHAHWRLENTMAKTPENAMKLMESVWPAAVARVNEEVADMQKLADKEGAKIKIEPWDYKFYMEKVRKDRYALDADEVKQYLQLEKVREAMFWVAGEVFGMKFTPLKDIAVFNPDMTVYEVKDLKGKHVGLWYFDPYARDGKRSGAWMNAYRNQERFKSEITTIVSNNSNFIKGKPGEPVLISWDDATTMFHEFGHAIHGLASNVTYPSLSGTNTTRDHVEFPSQVLERWLATPEVLNKFMVHYKTGKPIPQALVNKIKKADTFMQGFDTTEYLSSALVDMKLHLAGGEKIDPDAFEKKALADLGMPKELVMRHRTPQFGHLFSSDGYSAGYYSYLWSDVLSADAWEAFTEGKGAYDKKVGDSLVKNIFSVGNTIDPAEGYRRFRGRDPQTAALMRARGFPVPK